MAERLVRILQRRKLYEAPGYIGYEGDSKEYGDWLLIDCYNIIVHIMLPVTRNAIDLESLWSGETIFQIMNHCPAIQK